MGYWASGLVGWQASWLVSQPQLIPLAHWPASLLAHCLNEDRSPSSPVVPHRHVPRLTTDLAIFDVVLLRSTTRVEPDGTDFAAVGAGDIGFEIGDAITQRKLFIQRIRRSDHARPTAYRFMRHKTRLRKEAKPTQAI